MMRLYDRWMQTTPRAVDNGRACLLHEWLQGGLGGALLAAEQAVLAEVIAGLFGPVAVQVGLADAVDLLDSSTSATRIAIECCDHAGSGPRLGLRARPEALPFDSRSVNVLVLPHTLDFAEEPHQVLREASRVLVPEGGVVLIGFNPVSLWGLWRPIARCWQRSPWSGHFISLVRIKDWLTLLDFRVESGRMIWYRPPCGNASVGRRLAFLDRAGARWWPMTAAVYVLVARKREPGLTPLLVRRRRSRLVRPRLVEPATRRTRDAR